MYFQRNDYEKDLKKRFRDKRSLFFIESISNDGIILHKDMRYSKMFKINFFASNELSSDLFDEITNSLYFFLKGNDDYTYQFSFIKKKKQVTIKSDEDSNIFAKFDHEYRKHLGTKDVYSIDVFLTIKERKRKTNVTAFFKGVSNLFTDYEHTLKNFDNLEQALVNIPNFSGKITALSKNDVLQVHRNFLKNTSTENHCQSKSYFSQVSSDICVEKSAIDVGDSKLFVVKLEKSPKYSFSSVLADIANIDTEFSYTLYFSFISKQKSIKELTYYQGIPVFSAERKKESTEAIQKIDDGDLLVNMCMFFVTPKTSTIEEYIQKSTVLAAESAIEQDLAPELFYSSLPSNFNESIQIFDEYSYKVHLSDAVCFMPIYRPTPVFNDGHSLFLTKFGVPTKLDIYRSANVFHTIYIGQTGKGKNTLFEKIYRDILKNEELNIAIIENQSNQTHAHKFINANFIKFQKDAPMPINVLVGDKSAEQNTTSSNIVRSILATYNPEFKINGKVISIISKACKNAYLDKSDLLGRDCNLPVSIDDLMFSFSLLMADDEVNIRLFEQILETIDLFSSSGEYSHVFSNKAPSKTDQSINIFDLEYITDEKLKSVITTVIIEEVSKKHRLTYKKGIKTIIAVTEVKILDSTPRIGEFIDTTAQIGRKKNISLHVLAPDTEELLSTKAGSAMCKAATNLFISKCSHSEIKLLKDFYGSELSDNAIKQIENVEFKKGEFSEFFHLNREDKKGVTLRFYPSEVDFKLSPNSQKQESNLEVL